MPYSYFYHYTDDEGAKNIIRSGKILASLSFMATDDAGYGNGVYLTKLKPQTHTKAQIAMNNWLKTSAPFLKRTENYFVISIPDSEIKDATSKGRDIFLFGRQNDLSLHKYHWWLKNYDSNKIISSHKFTLASYGPASLVNDLDPMFGDYAMSDETVNGRPVYKHQHVQAYLFMNIRGNWSVSDNAGEYAVWFVQVSNYSLGPQSNVPWRYSSETESNEIIFNEDDATLKAYAWQK